MILANPMEAPTFGIYVQLAPGMIANASGAMGRFAHNLSCVVRRKSDNYVYPALPFDNTLEQRDVGKRISRT